MKAKKYLLTIFGIFLVLSFLLLSCRTSEKAAVSCPEFSINKNNKVAVDHKRIRNKALTVHYRVNTRKQPVRLTRKNHEKSIIVFKNSPIQDDVIVHGIESVSDLNKIEYSKGLIASIDDSFIPLVRNSTTALSLKKINMNKRSNNLIITQPSGCDTIVLKSGSILIGKVEEIGLNEIKYRKCNNLTGPIVSISKSDVSVIMYTNGTHEILTSPNPTVSGNYNVITTDSNTIVKTEGLGIAGFVSSLVGLIIAGIPLGLIGVIFGGISLSKIKKNPNRFKGKGFAIASIIIGIIAIVGAIIVIAVMY